MRFYDQEEIVNNELAGYFKCSGSGLMGLSSMGAISSKSQALSDFLIRQSALRQMQQRIASGGLSDTASGALVNAQRYLSGMQAVLNAWGDSTTCLQYDPADGAAKVITNHGGAVCAVPAGTLIAGPWVAAYNGQLSNFLDAYNGMQYIVQSNTGSEDQTRAQAVAVATTPTVNVTDASSVSIPDATPASATDILSLLTVKDKTAYAGNEEPTYGTEGAPSALTRVKAANSIAAVQANPTLLTQPTSSTSVAVSPNSDWFGPVMDALKTGANAFTSVSLTNQILQAQRQNKPIYVDKSVVQQAQKSGMPSALVLGGGAAAILLFGLFVWAMTSAPASPTTAGIPQKGS
jgi:hypothetical protein